MANKPNIRFKGFTDDWEQRKLGECAIFNPKSELPDIFEYVDLESVVGTNILCHRTENKSSAPLRAQRLAQKKDVFYQTVRPYQMNNCIFENDEDNWVFSTGYAQLRPYNDSYFLLTLLQNDDFVKQVLDRCTGTSYPAINSNDLADIDVSIPLNENEQKKIGGHFRNLDHLITLHQRKCDETKKLKKFMLQKMFPKNGEKNPEIRFAGFTDDWEQRKLGEDLESIQTGTNLLGSENNNGMPLLKMGNIQRGYFDTSKLEYLVDNKSVEPENVAYYGDFFFNTRNTMELVGKGATWTGESGKYAFNSNIARFKLKGIDTIFFNFVYNTDSMAKQVHARAMGTTSVAAIYPRSLDSIDYCLPCIDEQKRIGDYFRNLDHLITLHQRK